MGLGIIVWSVEWVIEVWSDGLIHLKPVSAKQAYLLAYSLTFFEGQSIVACSEENLFAGKVS